jgi:hypothetical protein
MNYNTEMYGKNLCEQIAKLSLEPALKKAVFDTINSPTVVLFCGYLNIWEDDIYDLDEDWNDVFYPWQTHPVSCLHILVDDFNLEDKDIKWLLENYQNYGQDGFEMMKSFKICTENFLNNLLDIPEEKRMEEFWTWKNTQNALTTTKNKEYIANFYVDMVSSKQ